MKEKKSIIRDIDFGLIFIVVSLFVIGLMAIASATRVFDSYSIGNLSREVKVQTFAFVIGIVLIVIILLFDYHYFEKMMWIIYGLSVAILLLVYIPGLGVIRGNARSWINILNIIDVQPSEISKIGFIISFSAFLHNHKEDLNTIKTLLKVVLFISPFLILIFKQPDFGTLMVFMIITIGMIIIAKLDYKFIGIGLGAGILLGANADKFLSKTQMERLFAFLEPDNLSIPANYHVNASKTAIGSGMIYGRGIFKGIYHKADWLPVQETDFIFAVWVEETGFFGGIILVSLYLFLMMDLIKISFSAKEDFGSYIVIGILCMFLFQIVENLGMTMGLMPVTGVTLPFVSYGGTSMITNMIAIGLVLNVYMRRHRYGLFSEN